MSSSTQRWRNPFAPHQARLDRRALGAACLFVGAQFLLLVLLLPVFVESEPQEAPAIELIDAALVPDPPPPPEPIDIQLADSAPAAASPVSGAPLPAPAPRLDLPDPIVRLDLERMPAAPASLAVSAFDGLGTGQLPGLGGTGTGAGTGSGSGSGGDSDGGGNRQLFLSWAPSMRHNILQRFYPGDAKRARIAGLAKIDCELLKNEKVRDCFLIGEAPAGHGFGEAAMRAVPFYRLRQFDQNGARVYGERIIVNANFIPRGGARIKSTTAAEQFVKLPPGAGS